MPKETKEFWKTSEFWTMIVIQLLAILEQLAGDLPPKYGMPLMGAVQMGYAIARGIAKSGNPLPPLPATVVVATPSAVLPIEEKVHVS